MKKRWRINFYVLCMVIVVTSAGCTGLLVKRNYGRITPDRNATIAFETYQINPNYNYYISGSDVYPHVIIGLDKSYNIEPDLWKHVDMTPHKLRELVLDMEQKIRHLNMTLTLHGFTLLDDKGKQIGIWYSILEASTSLWMKDERTVIIITPPLDTYYRYDDY